MQYQKSVLITGKIAGKAVTIKTDVVNSEIPLQLSKESLKSAGTKIDVLEDKIKIFGKDISCILHPVAIMQFHYMIVMKVQHL